MNAQSRLSNREFGVALVPQLEVACPEAPLASPVTYLLNIEKSKQDQRDCVWDWTERFFCDSDTFSATLNVAMVLSRR